MSKKGFISIIPILVIAGFLVSSLALFSKQAEQAQKEAVGGVLSSSSGENKGSSSSSGSGSGSKSSDEEERDEESRSSGVGTSGTGSSGTTRIESRTDEGRTKIKTSSDKTKIEVRTEEGRFETKVENGKEETKIRSGNLRIEIKREGNKVVTRVKNEQDEEVELEDEEENELFAEVEDGLAEDGIRIATGPAGLGLIQHGRKVRTNFPLSVNAVTGELFVTTPAGEKVVAVLPDVAIENMRSAGILTRVVETVPAVSPGEGTAGAATVEGAGVELTTVNSQPVYVISGVRAQNFLGLVPVDIKIKAVVSIENGNLLDVQQGLLTRIIDLLSF